VNEGIGGDFEHRPGNRQIRHTLTELGN